MPHTPPTPRDPEFVSSESRDDACQMCGQTTTTADYGAEKEGQETCLCWEGDKLHGPAPQRRPPAESPGKGSWGVGRTCHQPVLTLDSSATLLPQRRPALPGRAQLSRERHVPSRGESVLGFLAESAQPFPDDSENSNIRVAECEDEASVSRVRREFQQEVVTDAGFSPPFLQRNSPLGRSKGVLMWLPGRGTEPLLSLGWPRAAPASSSGDAGAAETARRTSPQTEGKFGPVPLCRSAPQTRLTGKEADTVLLTLLPHSCLLSGARAQRGSTPRPTTGTALGSGARLRRGLYHPLCRTTQSQTDEVHDDSLPKPADSRRVTEVLLVLFLEGG